MESSKANTVGVVKNSPSCTYIQLVRPCNSSSGLLYFPQNGKGGINHPLLLELPHLSIKPQSQAKANKVKNDTLFKARDPQKQNPIRRYLPI